MQNSSLPGRAVRGASNQVCRSFRRGILAPRQIAKRLSRQDVWQRPKALKSYSRKIQAKSMQFFPSSFFLRQSLMYKDCQADTKELDSSTRIWTTPADGLSGDFCLRSRNSHVTSSIQSNVMNFLCLSLGPAARIYLSFLTSLVVPTAAVAGAASTAGPPFSVAAGRCRRLSCGARKLSTFRTRCKDDSSVTSISWTEGRDKTAHLSDGSLRISLARLCGHLLAFKQRGFLDCGLLRVPVLLTSDQSLMQVQPPDTCGSDKALCCRV